MSDMTPIPSTIDTHRAPSLADVEAKLRKLLPALDAFASELAAMPIPGSGQVVHGRLYQSSRFR
jgi:hypothetical protein